MYSSLKVLFFITCLIISFASLAKKVDMKLVDETCTNSSVACLDTVNTEIVKVKEKSAVWYELELLKLGSLFELAQFDALFKETSRWVEDESVSEYFRVKVLIYHTKLLQIFNDNEQRDKFRAVVEKTLVQLHDNFSDPSLIIDLVNLQLYSDKDPRVPYHMLRRLEKKFKNRPEPKFKYDLYNNLGHFASKMGHSKDSVIVREQALIWAKRSQSVENIAEGHFNFARSLQLNKNYQLAHKNFLISLSFYEQLAHKPNVSLAKLYISLMLWHLGSKDEAKSWFIEVKLSQLPIGRLPVYKALALSLDI